ncbi:MAG: 2-oxoglutarate oxidoreductase subunit KorA [Parcubacteria group bacterium ADurb.Bin216]|nr:MAG: 2-oxoglutarate oxidoreductase subunit KorA [Parcubacteria group bacterium ADurb.Bin216]
MPIEYSIIIGGQAGQGSRKAGLILAKVFKKLGYFVYIYDDYQSLVKGGHNFSQIRIADGPIAGRREKVDMVIALDKKTAEMHKKDLKKGGLMIFNSNKVMDQEGYGVEADKIVKDLGGIPIMANTAMIGGFAKIAGIDWSIIKGIVEKELNKGNNLEIAKAAYDSVEKVAKIEKVLNSKAPQLLMTGNEATALGAAKAGLDMYYAYPMTPASGLLHYFAEHQNDLGVLTIQLENEIAVANEAVGSAYAGKRTMIASSSGGFALFSEVISFTAMAETPVVFVNSQRMGPATGVPTYSGQSDLLFCINPGPGDFEKFVVAPSTAEETAVWSGKLLNWAWQYQTPAILLIDKELSEGTFSVSKDTFQEIKKEKELLWNKKGDYMRYRITEEGLSPLAYPGTPNAIIKASSYEHDEAGLTIETDEALITSMQEKRMRKFEEMKKVADCPEAVAVYGNKGSKTVVISWGFNAGAVKEVSEKLGLKFVQPIVMSPFPVKQMKKVLQGAEKIILVENNAMSQLGKVMAEYGIKADKTILKYSSRPFYIEELESRISKLISKTK